MPHNNLGSTLDDYIQSVTTDYIERLDRNNLPSKKQIKADLYAHTQCAILDHNSQEGKENRWPLPKTLYPLQIALIIANLYPICCIACDIFNNSSNVSPESEPLVLYQETGAKAGIYSTDELELTKLIRSFNATATDRDVAQIKSHLIALVPHSPQNEDPNLVPVANGIFDFRSKTLLPFSPKYVFLSKSQVAYNPSVVNPVIHNTDDGTDWDVETWVRELFDDPELVALTWEILGAIVRPYVHWNKMVLLYATTGCNGKGTLCQLLRNLCGSHTSIPMYQFGNRFGLASLMGALAVITDENDVGNYLAESAELKAAITHDVVHIEQKGKDIIDFIFHGLIVQCINQLDRTRDKSDSFYRRLLIVPFTKTFTGAERKYIKHDYLYRKDVLEYVLYRVLHMNHYEFSEPKACRMALGVFKEENETVLQFVNEILPECSWDLLPFGFLFDLYREWMRRNSPSSQVPNKSNFIDNLLRIVESDPEWTCHGRKAPVRPEGRMDWPEPLIDEYHLKNWEDPTRHPGYYSVPHLKANYNGLIRVRPKGRPKQFGGASVGAVPTD